MQCDHSLTDESKSLGRCSALSLKLISQLHQLGSIIPYGLGGKVELK